MLITLNKNLNPLSNLLINCMPPKSEPEILCINGECTFLLLNFQIFGSCNTSTNSSLDIISFLTVRPEVFFIKKLINL